MQSEIVSSHFVSKVQDEIIMILSGHNLNISKNVSSCEGQ